MRYEKILVEVTNPNGKKSNFTKYTDYYGELLLPFSVYELNNVGKYTVKVTSDIKGYDNTSLDLSIEVK